MYKFNQKEVDLMAVLGFKTDMEQAVCYESWEEAFWEQKANGIDASSFRVWLARKIAWEQQKNLLKNRLTSSIV
jgi:hypothetical protein